jgi:N-acetylglucosamine-6-sulfatase
MVSRIVSVVIAVTILGGLAAAALGMSSAGKPAAAPAARPAAATTAKPTGAWTAKPSKPNIVFILTDDLSWNLINRRWAPHIVALEKRGETFNHYYVADSLCCPSRSTIFTGLFPHDTKVVANIGRDGGFKKFQSEHLDKRTFAVAIQRHGYATAMMGKYLNGYGKPTMTPTTAPVAPGWSDWHVVSNGYLEFNYYMNANGKVVFYGGATGRCRVTGRPNNYGVDVLNSTGRTFINRRKGKPFVLEVATFAPHSPYIPAPRNACDFPGLTEPRDPSFNRASQNPPAWLAQHQTTALTAPQTASIDKAYRMRAQSVEAVDKLLADVETTLARDHLERNTYIVFSSDNGYHLGQHRLSHGKQTAFETDIRVPLIIAGPGVPAGKRVPQVVQNVDLYPTFVGLTGSTPHKPVDGRSLLPLLHPGKQRPAWRTVALIEHQHVSRKSPDDPDAEDGVSPTTYEAIRIVSPHLTAFKGSVNAVYVEYKDAAHELEFYDLSKDPFELHNTASTLTAAQKAQLHKIVGKLETCHNAHACWSGARPIR